MFVVCNFWCVVDVLYIVLVDFVECQMVEWLINVCLVGFFLFILEGDLCIDYCSCLECGICCLLCDELIL